MQGVALMALCLAAAPVDGELSEGATRVLHDLEAGTDEALDGAGTATLERALAEVRDHALDFAFHPEALELREEASFALVQALLNAEPPREQEAALYMDEAIRSSQGRELETAGLGPTLEQFHDERLASLRARGTAEIVVGCAIPCRVTINERARSTYPSVLLLGRYRVHVVSRDGEHREDHEIDLARAGALVELQFPRAQAVELPPPRLRRGDEIALSVLSVGVIAGGAAVFVPHNRCIDDPSLDWKTDYIEGSQCEQTFNTAWIGGALVTVGVVGLITSIYLLVDDEKRRRRMRAVNLSGRGLAWSVSF